MSVSERELVHTIMEINYYFNNQHLDYVFKEKAVNLLKTTFVLISENLVDFTKNLSADLLVELAECGILINEYSTLEISDNILNVYFELEGSKNTAYVKSLILKAQIESKNLEKKNLKAEEATTSLRVSVGYILKALEIIAKPENKGKYGALVYNASIITYNILKRYYKPNWAKNFFDVMEKISAMLEEADDVDYPWRLRFLTKLAQCYLDADKKPESAKALDKIGDIIKRKGELQDLVFQDELFRYRVHLSKDNPAGLTALKKEAETSKDPSLKFIHTLQVIKSGAVADSALEKEYQTFITAIYSEFFKVVNENSTLNVQNVKIEAWKADAIAEMGTLLCRAKFFNQASNVYDFLNRTRANTLKGKILIENIKAQLLLIKLENELKVNVLHDNEARDKRIEVRTEAIRVLERNLSGCMRLMDLDLINETCIIIFNLAIPLLKKSYNKNYLKAFVAAADILEQINSNEFSLRASFHLEIAKCYLNEDLLQEADTNLIKALTLDYSLPINKLPNDLTNVGNAGNTSQTGNLNRNNKTSIKDESIYINKDSNTSGANINIAYLQRNLDQYLIYLKRVVTVKTNIYSDPEPGIDQLIFESDNIKHAKNEEVKVETIKKCVEIIKSYTLPEFNADQMKPSTMNKELVDEEYNELKTKFDLKLYDEKKHFVLACLEIARLSYEYNEFHNAIKILEVLNDNKNFSDWNFTRDIEQLVALAEMNTIASQCYEEFLLDEGVEIGTAEIINFADNTRVYSEPEKEHLNKWKTNLLNHIKAAIRLAVSVSQYWLVFNVAIQLWNILIPVIRSNNFTTIANDSVLPVMGDAYEAMNSGVIFLESTGSEVYDTDYYAKIDLFVNLTAAYCKLLEAKGKPEEAIRICDVVLTRKLTSNMRKYFDGIRSRALKANDGKKVVAKTTTNTATKNNTNVKVFQPTADQLLVSDCFASLESASIAKDEKSKLEFLKKGTDSLKNYKINFNDESTIELNSELWYKYGVQYFALGNYKMSLYCADNCVKTFNLGDINLSDNMRYTTSQINANKTDKNSEVTGFSNRINQISHSLQKWYCVGYLLYGDSIYKLVDKDKQERYAQIKLYFNAIDKIIRSAKIAEKCKQHYVILQTVKAFYSIVINIVDQSQNRELLAKRFLELHKILINNKNQILYGDPGFMLLFYSFFCLCINETKDWNLGEQVISEGLKMIPNSLHHFLLEHKLFYYSKLGKSFLQNLQGGDDKDVTTKAKLFTKLARSSQNKMDQFNAYNKAIDLLKNDENMLVVDVIFELGCWLYKNNYPFDDIEDQLLQAADFVLDIDQMFDAEEEDLEEENKTMHSKRSTSIKSRISKKSKQSKSKQSQDKKKSITGKRSSIFSKTSNRTSRSRNYSNAGSKTKTVFSKIMDYDPYPLFMNVKHLEQLVKIHVFLAIIVPDLKKRQEYLLDAFYFLMKIFDISYKTLNCFDFYDKNKEDILKQAFVSQNELNPLTALINNYFMAKDLNIPQTYSLPDTMEGWVTYTYPEAFTKKLIETKDCIQRENIINLNPSNQGNNLNSQNTIKDANLKDKTEKEKQINNELAIKSLITSNTFFTKKSFEKPYLFYYYLKFIIDKFCDDFYFHTQCVALLKFMILFCEFVLDNEDLKFLYTLKLKRLYHNILNYDNKADSVSSNIFKEIDSYISANFNQFLMTPEKKHKYKEELKKIDINLNTDTEKEFSFDSNDLSGNTNRLSVYVVEKLDDHAIWIDIAKELFNYGYFNYAKEYLGESIFHCLVLRDKTNFIKANLIQAKISFVEADFEQSFILFNKIQIINQDIEIFYEIVINMANVFSYLNKFDELIHFCDNAIKFLEDYGNSPQNSKNKNIYENFVLKIHSYLILVQVKAKMKKLLYENANYQVSANSLSEKIKTISDLVYYYKTEISSKLKKYDQIIQKFGTNTVNNINVCIEFVELSTNILINSTLFTYVKTEELDLISEIMENCMSILVDSQGFLNNLQTYVPARLDNSLLNLPIHQLIGLVKIKYAFINNLIGELKNRIKRDEQMNDVQDGNLQNTNNFSQGVKYNQQVIDLLNSLTKEMDKMHLDKSAEKNRYEKSIALLSSSESLLSNMSKEFILYFIEKINSYRLQALHNKELKNIWDGDKFLNTKSNMNMNDSNVNTQTNMNFQSAVNTGNNVLSPNATNSNFKIHTVHQQTLNFIQEFDKFLPNLFSNSMRIKELTNYYLNVLESSGYLNIELSFKALCDYQQQITRNYFIQILENYIEHSQRDWVITASLNYAKEAFNYNPLINSMSFSESLQNLQRFYNELPYMKIINFNFNTWSDIKNLLPLNSSYFIFQMNEERTILYIGYMYNILVNSERKFDYYLKRILINNEVNNYLDESIKVIRKMKHILLKSVIVTKEDLATIYEEYNLAIKDILALLENTFTNNWFDLNSIINPEVKFEEGENKEKKKVAANPTANKKEKYVVNIDINYPNSGIESITFCIDKRFYELPFENLNVFSKIPFKSNDFSLLMNAYRLKVNNFNPQVQNFVNVEKSLLKYYLDYSNKMEIKTDPKKMIENKITLGKEGKIEGLASYEHYPSIPELQKLYTNSTAFVYASQTSFLYQYPPYEILESSKFTKTKLGIIIDRISNIKNYVDQKSLIPKYFSLTNQPLDLFALLTLSGLSTIVTSKWSLSYEESIELLEDIIDESNKQLPISYGLHKYRNPKKIVIIDQDKDKDKDIKKKNLDRKNSVLENIVVNENIPLIEKKEIFQYAPIIYGLNCLKLN